MAKRFNMTSDAFLEAVSAKKVKTLDFMRNFTIALNERAKGGLSAAVSSSTAQLNRLENVLKEKAYNMRNAGIDEALSRLYSELTYAARDLELSGVTKIIVAVVNDVANKIAWLNDSFMEFGWSLDRAKMEFSKNIDFISSKFVWLSDAVSGVIQAFRGIADWFKISAFNNPAAPKIGKPQTNQQTGYNGIPIYNGPTLTLPSAQMTFTAPSMQTNLQRSFGAPTKQQSNQQPIKLDVNPRVVVENRFDTGLLNDFVKSTAQTVVNEAEQRDIMAFAND